MAMAYHHFDAITSFMISDSWNFHAASVVAWRAIYISWEPLLLGFVKVNFDSSIHYASDGAGYVIWDTEGKFLVVRRFFLHELSIPEVRLKATWAGIMRAIQGQHTEKILIREDSTIVIS